MAELPSELPSTLVEGPAVRWKGLLFTSHFVASWGERMWEFSVGLLLLQVGGGESLQLPAVLQLCVFANNLLFGAMVGRIVDYGSAITMPVASLALQSGGIALAAVSSAWALDESSRHQGFLLWFSSENSTNLAVVCVIGCTCAAKLAFLARSLSLEKRWPKALATESAELATLNSQLRRIDLTCKIMAPCLAGVIMNYVSLMGAGVLVAAVNVIAWPIEALCLRKIYNDQWCKEQLDGVVRRGAGERVTRRQNAQTEMATRGNSWSLYFAQQDLWLSAFALSMLHFTVLSFGQVMTAYVMTLGVPPAFVAAYRGFGEVFGFSATLLAPRIIKGGGPAKSGVIFSWAQLLMLIPSAVGASAWARSLPFVESSALLVGGVAVSRLGLWGFDLSVTQLIQERTRPESALASVSGVQHSLEAAWSMACAVLCTVLHRPEQFQYLAYASVVAVFCAATLHTTSYLCIPSAVE